MHGLLRFVRQSLVCLAPSFAVRVPGRRSGWPSISSPPDAVSPQLLAELHAKDLAIQHKHGVRYIKYWYDAATGRVFCLSDAPSKEAAIAVHREAHGLLADTLVEVTEGA